MSGFIGNGGGSLGRSARFIYTATEGQTVFSGPDDRGLTLKNSGIEWTEVVVNGMWLPPTDYTVNNASQVTLGAACAAGDQVYIFCLSAFNPADGLSLTQNGADIPDKSGFLTNLGGTTLGKSLFTVANTNDIQTIVGATTTGKALLTAANEAAALAALPSAYHKANILGTVSQSGGVPTGAILERGNNANGEYTRFANGLQICTKKDSIPSGTGSNFGWTFPATFPGGEPYVAMNMAIGAGSDAKNYNAQMQYQGISASSAILTYTTASTVTGYFIAIGRWF